MEKILNYSIATVCVWDSGLQRESGGERVVSEQLAV